MKYRYVDTSVPNINLSVTWNDLLEIREAFRAEGKPNYVRIVDNILKNAKADTEFNLKHLMDLPGAQDSGLTESDTES